MLKVVKSKHFANGSVYALKYWDGTIVETTDTFLPFYTKECRGLPGNQLKDASVGSRSERWMIGVSVARSCPVRCKFCATGQLKGYRPLTWGEICQQVLFAEGINTEDPSKSQEFKVNYTRMGEPYLNIDNVGYAINWLNDHYDGKIHHFVSTIGIKGSDFSWIRDNITLQISLHSLREETRNELIPFGNKMSIEELGRIRTNSNLKTTLNLTLVDESDFDIETLKKFFDPKYFFIKLSPLNENCVSVANRLNGIIKQENYV